MGRLLRAGWLGLALLGATAIAPAGAGATPIHTTAGGCAIVNSSASAPSSSCSFDALPSGGVGTSGYTDTGWSLSHLEKVPVYDQHGCALTTATGALATQLVRVQDASGQAGPIVSLDTFTPQITYTLQLNGNGYAQTGTVDPTAGAGSDPTTEVPIDRTAGVAPGCHSGLPNFAGATPGDPLKLISVKRLDPRTWELQLSTPSVTGPTGVRILLPENFDASGATRYPVLYLLHGALDSYTSWTDKGNAEALTAGFKGIVVMPDTGTGGGYVDWYNSGAFGPPAWETYHIGQLLPWIDGHLPTIAARRGRAIAGLSMGGYGAMEYASRHADQFVFAGSFSGAVDVMNTGLRAEGFPTDIEPSSPYGDPLTNEIYFRGHNPTDLAENLKGLVLDIRTGNGMPGGGDPSSSDLPFDPVEADVEEQSIAFHNALNAAGVSSVFDDYGPGSHAWYYWERDLTQSLPRIEAAFAHPPADPAAVDFKSSDPSFEAYGWQVAVTREAREFGELLGARASGFVVKGSGKAKVTTPGLYRPGSRVTALIRSGTATTKLAAIADSAGRVTFAVPLGPSNTVDEYSPQARAMDLTNRAQRFAGKVVAGSRGTVVYTTNVELSAARRPAGRR